MAECVASQEQLNNTTEYIQNTDYLHKINERYMDSELFNALCRIAFKNDKSVKMIEDAGLITGALFYDWVLNSHAPEMTLSTRETERAHWFTNSKIVLEDAELIFAYPDSGLTAKKNARMLHPDDYLNYMRLIGDFDRTYWHKFFSCEYVDGKIPGSEKIGDSFEVTMKDGTVITLARRADGEIELNSTRCPNVTRRITSEMLEQYLHLY